MATSEVSKYSVYDPRVVQTKPKYAVEKGALSLTNVSFNAQTANSTSQQFNVIVPSENVFIDRAVEWISGGVITVPINLAGAVSAGQVLLSPSEVSFAAFPSHQCVAQMTATINDATVTVNTQDVLNYVLRLQDLAKHRRQRTCPTMLETYAIEPSAATANSPLQGYEFRFEADELPNGAYGQWWFCDVNGAPLTTNNGLPVTTSQAGASTQNVYIRWQSSEHLLLPPFIFGDAFELSTGLFGVQNFQVQMNMAPTPARAVRIASSVVGRPVGSANTTTTISSIGTLAWNTASGVGSYAPYPNQPTLSVQFLTPALDVPLPPKSIVPYMEFPRYITTGISAIDSTLGKVQSAKGVQSGSSVIQSNTITLPNIPDLLLMYLKPAAPTTTVFSSAPYANGPTTWDSTIGDFTLPIQAVSINFDNFSGLLANHTQYQLYKMSVNNGLEMDFATWAGEARDLKIGAATVASASNTTLAQSPYVSTVGGPLVLRPGRDFALQAGQAPGLVGNFTLQVNLTVGNQFASQIAAGGVNLYIVPISSGFFETIKGSSRIIKGVLTEQDILSAPPHAPSEELERKVGAAKKMGHKGHAMSADAIYG